MAIAMTTGYSAQTEGALLCIEAASDWALMIGSLTLVLLRIGSGLGDSTSIDALQAFIVITAVPVTPLVLATLWSAPRLAWKEWRRTTVTPQ